VIDLAASCLVITALLAWLNRRFVGLPSAIGLMAAAMVLSLALIALDATGIAHGPRAAEERLSRAIDFSDVLMQGMLSLLLFAGALHVDLAALRRHAWGIGALAVAGTVASALAIGAAMWLLLPAVGLELPLLHCLLFGVLIAPTDPIAVMGIMRASKAPRDLVVVIEGESLFNDGVGVVLFAVLAEVLAHGSWPDPAGVGALLLQEAGGGIAFGLVLGYLTYAFLRSIDQYQVEVLITLAAVMGGYALAHALRVSGPLAMVAAGVVVGNRGRALAMSDTTRRYVDMFWELLDEILNAVLFVLLGIGALMVAFSRHELLGGMLAIAVSLAARALAVGLPVAALSAPFGLPRGSWRVLTWGGLRGGISVALALSLPAGPARDTVLALTYCVVVFSVLVQGLTIGWVVRRTFDA
jgi:CPA1 family monovalent cation:H+ antiporter